MTKRPDWDEYFLSITKEVAKRGTCCRAKCGCVITKDNVILSTGYNGAPKGMPHCEDLGSCLEKEITHPDGHKSIHCMRTVHAEVNAILQAAKNGIAIKNSTLYCGMTPCINCAMVIANSGVKRVVAEKDYHESSETKQLFLKSGIYLYIKETGWSNIQYNVF